MKLTLNNTKKSKRGRPSVDSAAVTVRMAAEALHELDAWRQKRDDRPGRPEAIRRLVELGLTVKTKSKQPSAARAERAKELAAKTIEKIIDPSAPPDERIERKRRLTKGPVEFRNARVDQPKAKGK